jgi:Mg2+/citrate symporter
MKGWKTLTFGVFLGVMGVIASLLMAVNDSMVQVILPDKYKPFSPLIITVIGIVVCQLRLLTDTAWGRKDDGNIQ